MQLSKLLERLEYEVVQGSDQIEISTLINDSRKVENGSAFVCIKGAVVDGHEFVQQVSEKGASAVIVEDEVNAPKDMTVIRVPDTRYALALMSAAYFGGPVFAARSQALSDTKHLRPLCRTGRCEKGGCDCERQIKPAEEKPQRLKTGRPCPPSRRSPMWRCTRTGYASSPAGSTQRSWNMRTSIIPWHPPRIRLQSLAAGAHFSTTLTAPCRSSFPLSTAAPTPGAAIR